MIFYTYIWLRDDGTPYYVGKGHGKRAFRTGCPPFERIILQEWETELEAFAAERLLISLYGRKDNGTGVLRNLTDGGDGSANPAEHVLKAHSIAGRRNVETGHLQKISSAGGKAAAKFLLETSTEARKKGGRISGQAHSQSGHIQALGKKYGGKFLTPEVHAKAGRIGGRKNADSGQIQTIQLTANHIRWHVKRNVVNPSCPNCVTSTSVGGR